MDAQKKGALEEHLQELRTGIIVANFLPECRKMFSEVEYSRINDKAERDSVSGVDELVKILLTKTDKEFDGFCKVLSANGYEHWARRLKDRVQEKDCTHGNTPKQPGEQVQAEGECCFTLIHALS